MEQNSYKKEYQYSKLTPIFWATFLLGIVGYSFPHLMKFIRLEDLNSSLLIAIFDLAFFALFISVTLKFLIPALQGKLALEISEDGLVDYISGVSVSWNDVKEVYLAGRTSNVLIVRFKFKTDRGSYLKIPLQWVACNDELVCDEVKHFIGEL